MAGISIEQLASEIAKGLEDYSKDTIENINTISQRVGAAAVRKLKEKSPKREGGGNYARAWKMTTQKGMGQADKRIIHVKKPHYRLTHLLENGHAKEGGGRVEARPHIKGVEEEVIREFMNDIEEALESGRTL